MSAIFCLHQNTNLNNLQLQSQSFYQRPTGRGDLSDHEQATKAFTNLQHGYAIWHRDEWALSYP